MSPNLAVQSRYKNTLADYLMLIMMIYVTLRSLCIILMSWRAFRPHTIYSKLLLYYIIYLYEYLPYFVLIEFCIFLLMLTYPYEQVSMITILHYYAIHFKSNKSTILFMLFLTIMPVNHYPRTLPYRISHYFALHLQGFRPRSKHSPFLSPRD